jgi:hypothetical protein
LNPTSARFLSPGLTNIQHIRSTNKPEFKMKSMTRQFGKLTSKGQGDNAKVSVLIADYDDADKSLTKVGSIPMTQC